MGNLYRLLAALLLTVPAWGTPSMEWGLMIGDDVDAPAGFRELDGFRYDFTVIVEVTPDFTAKLDSAALTLAIDTANGFELPPGESLTKTVYNIPRSTPEFFIWHIRPPAVENTFANALRVTGSYAAGAATAGFPALSRSITVRKVKGTGQYQVTNNTIGDFLAGQIITINQYVTLSGGNPRHFVWGLFLSRYDVLDIMSISTTLPGAPLEPHTYLPQATSLPDGTYRITYLCDILRGNTSMSLNNQFYGLTGLWRGIDSQLAGVGFPDWQVYNQGFAGSVTACATGAPLVNIPVSVYDCSDRLIDDRPMTGIGGTYSFGLRDAGQYKLYFNDPARDEYDPNRTSYYDDNVGACYSLALDQTITVNPCLSELNGTTGSLDTILVTPYSPLVPTGNTVVFTATGYDSMGNQLPADSLGTIIWTGGSSIGVLSSGTFGDRAFFTARTAGYDTIRVQSVSGATGRTGAVFVEDAGLVGTLDSLAVTPYSAVTSIGNAIVFTAAGYDSAGNELPLDSLGALTWSGGDAIGSFTGQQNNVAYFTGSATGSDTLTVSAGSNGTTGRTGTVTVVGGPGSGPLHSIGIIPASPTVTVGENALFQAIAYDSLGRQLPSDSLGTLSWSGAGTIGSITQDNNTYIIFTVTAAGTGVLQARSSVNGITGSTGTITAVEASGGALVRMDISPYTATIGTGDTIIFRVTGYDSDNNDVPVDSLGTLAWNNGTEGIFFGAADDSVFYVAANVGVDTVTATSSHGPITATGNINVVAGAPDIGPPVRIEIVPETATGAQDTTLRFTVAGYDSADSPVADTALDRYLVWSGGSNIGFITDGTGVTGALTVTTAGTDRIIVRDTFRGLADTSGIITGMAGLVTRVTVTDIGGAEIGTAAHTTDDDGVTYYVRGYTPAGNHVVGITASWSSIGDTIVSLSPATGSAVSLTLTGSGRFRLIAEYTPGIADTTGLITVTGGTAVSLSVTPDTGTVSADDSLRFTVTGTDADGSATTDMGVLFWSAGDGITGSFSPNNTLAASSWFLPVQAGTGYVVVRNTAGLTDTADAITVTAGDTAAVRIFPSTPDTLYLDEQRSYTANGYDVDGNLIGPIAADWDTAGTLNGIFSAFTASPTFSYTATGAGAGKVYATYAGSTMRDSVSITVVNVRIADIAIVAPGKRTELTIPIPLTTDIDDYELAAAGFDQSGAFIGYVSVDWQLLGAPVGRLSMSPARTVTLELTAPGDAYVYANYQGRAEDSTSIIHVAPGRVSRFTISPHDTVLENGDTLVCRATAYDADGNTTTDYGTLAWTSEAGLASMPSTGGTAPYVPLTAGTDTVTVRSVTYGVTASTGPYRVNPRVDAYALRRDSSRVSFDVKDAIPCTLIALSGGARMTTLRTNADTIRLNVLTYAEDGGIRTPAGTVTLSGPGVTTAPGGGYVIRPDTLFTDGARIINVGYDRSGEYVYLACSTSVGDTMSDAFIWEDPELLTGVTVSPSPVNFNRADAMRIRYVLKEDARVVITVLSPLGSLIREITCEKTDLGGRKWQNVVEWDGTTRNGKPAASGGCIIKISVFSEQLGNMQTVVKTGVIGKK